VLGDRKSFDKFHKGGTDLQVYCCVSCAHIVQASVSSLVPRENIDLVLIQLWLAVVLVSLFISLQSLLRALQLLNHYWVILEAIYSIYPDLYTTSEDQFCWADNQYTVVVIVVGGSASVGIVLTCGSECESQFFSRPPNAWKYLA
jgi:hypothetical protein